MPAAPTRSLAIPMLLVVLTALVVTAIPFWVIRPWGEERAFPLGLVLEGPVSLDTVGGVPVALLVAPDGQSVRAFEARLDGRPLELFGRAPAPGEWLDLELRSWGFDGCTVEAGTRRCLSSIPIFRSYWFDWLEHHPRTTVATPLGLKRRVR